MNRRRFLSSAAAAPLWARAQGQAPRYNVLMLKSDEHNPRYSSVHGHPFVETPNMDRLAERGTLFENNYCPSPLCLPSRSSFMAGRPVFELQTYGNCNAITHDYPSYGKVLKEQGVHSVHIGKTDVWAHSSTLGFSEMLAPGDRAQPGDTRIRRNPPDVDASEEGFGKKFGVAENPFRADLEKVKIALDWLANTAPKVQQPWTMELNLVKPHFPHVVTQDLWDLYAEHADVPSHGKDCESGRHPWAQDLRAFFGTDKFSEADARGLRRGYYGCVTFIDRQLGRVLDAIEKSPLRENTIVVYTSDHGEMLGKFGMWWKRSLYEDSVRVPLIVAGPGFKAGARVATPTTSLDLQATLFRATGARRPAGWSGTPLQDVKPGDSKRAVFAEYQDGGTRASGFMLRKGDWKLLYYAGGPHQLFDLKNDPEELDNLAKKRPEVFKDMERELRRICDPERENRRAEEFIARELEAIARKRTS